VSVGWLFDRGMNIQALVTAPKPERRPRMRVPSTMSRARAAVVREVGASAVGRGTWERAKRYIATGARLSRTLPVSKRLRHRGTNTRIVAMRMASEILQCSKRVLAAKIFKACVINSTNIVQLSVNDSAKTEHASTG
jgi:hypothetical protein